VLLAALCGCSSEGSGIAPAPVGDTVRGGAAASIAKGTTLAVVAEAPATVAFELDLDGERFELALERTRPPTTTDYQSFRRTRDGALIPLPPPALGCTYRGVTEAAPAAGNPAGFAAMSVCAAATGHEAGQAASGVLSAGGRFWRLTPDPLDTDASDGLDHFAQPLVRGDSPASGREPPRRTTLRRLPESPAPRLEFREGTDAETKYIELIAVNDAARVADIGGGTEATTIQFVDTMNALLDTSGLSPRLRVTLRGQVLFDQDPYRPELVGDEVDINSLLNEFLAWGAGEDLPTHDEHMLLSGLDFEGGVVGYAGLNSACTINANGFMVQAGDASDGFAVLSAVHELGHTLGMNHDDGSRRDCPSQGFIMAAVGCGNCPGAEQAEFSPCSIEQFQDYLTGPAYAGVRCADDVPAGSLPSCGDGAVEAGETCDCGSNDCSDIDPCCDGATCQLQSDAECSDFNDGCCRSCAVVPADPEVVCRAQRSACDIAEVCNGSKACPADTFEAAGQACQDDRGNTGACYFGDCRSRGTQCEQIAEQQSSTDFDGVGAPPARCGAPCSLDQIVCGNGGNTCLTIGGPGVNDGVPCANGQCVDGQCVSAIDQCPNDPQKDEPGECGCGKTDADSDGDGAVDCADGCPDDSDKQTPGACGCGKADTDSDGDGAADCDDQCPSDAQKSEPGDCGCGSADIDSDGDGAADCIDACPNDSAQRTAGACGCGVPEVDSDFDGTPDCIDGCITDPSSIAPPCAIAGGTDTDGDGDVDVSSFSSRGSAKGGCSITLPGAVPSTASSSRTSRGLATHLGWLALAVLPVLRRRRAARG
jgi:Reprolysin (M12B) family zinc metalloprotease/Disintegrin